MFLAQKKTKNLHSLGLYFVIFKGNHSTCFNFCVLITQNSLNSRNVLLVIIIIVIITISTYIEKIALKGADKNKIRVLLRRM